MKEKTFDFKKFEVQSDAVLDIMLKYALVGEVNNEKDNCILLLTSYAATHEDALDLIPIQSFSILLNTAISSLT